MSETLEDLVGDGFIYNDEKMNYRLTDMGKELNEILYSLPVFGAKHFRFEVYAGNIENMKEKGLIYDQDEIDEISVCMTAKD